MTPSRPRRRARASNSCSRGSSPAALRAQRLLAAMSQLAFERLTPAGVVLAPPVGWYPDLDAHRALITGLQNNPLLTAVTLDTLFESVPTATGETGSVVHELAPITPAPFPITSSAFAAANSELSALASTVGARRPRDCARRTRARPRAQQREHVGAGAGRSQRRPRRAQRARHHRVHDRTARHADRPAAPRSR